MINCKGKSVLWARIQIHPVRNYRWLLSAMRIIPQIMVQIHDLISRYSGFCVDNFTKF
jgi:hypothetical protein